MKKDAKNLMDDAKPFQLDAVRVKLVKEAPLFSELPLQNPYDAVAAIGDLLCDMDREVVCVVNLQSDLKPINVTFASIGSLNEAMVHPREMLKASILSNAASVMLIHSHPSGNLLPSKQDTMITDRMTRIADRRKELGLTQDELAHRIGIGRQALSAIENGGAFKAQTLERLVSALDVSERYIMRGEIEDSKAELIAEAVDVLSEMTESQIQQFIAMMKATKNVTASI